MKIEQNGFKNELFTAIKEWQKARKSGAFTNAQIERFKDPATEFHLSKKSENTWELTPVHLQTGFEHKYRQVQTGEPILTRFKVKNENGVQPFRFYIIPDVVEGNTTVTNLTIDINNDQTIEINEPIKAGDRIFCGGKTIYLCDATWNKVKEIKPAKLPAWTEGENEIVVKSEFSDNQAPVLKMEFKSFGKPETVTAARF